MSITAELHDGTRLEFPDGTDPAVIQRTVKGVLASKQAAETPKPSVAERIGSTLREIPRQVGLTARYGLEGAGQALQPFTEPIRLAMNPLLRAAGAPTAASTGNAASQLADTIGLPTPQGPNERVVADATRTLASAGALSGAAGAAARGATGVTRNVLEQLAARPGVQAAGAATAGASGGAVREAGGGPVEQFAAALGGGVAGGAAAGKVGGLADAARRALTPRTVQLQQADQQIQLVLQRSGVDWAQVPERIRQGMREEAAAALSTGQPLNERALQRLLVFQRTGTTPTVGMLTQNPGQITREMNLAKTGANSTDVGLQRLPGLQNQNTAKLLSNLDEAGAANAPASFQAGEKAIGSLQGNVDRARREIDSLYGAARDSQGRSLPLEPGTFTRRANELLDQEMVGGALPGDVANRMNQIATGEMPLTVEIAEQLKTRIGKLQRSTSDGSARMALGLVRQALDETPLMRINPQNLPVAPGTQLPPSGQKAIDAFNLARSANRQFMNRVEANPALKAVVDGVEPDQFVQKFVLGKGASAGDVSALRQELDPQALASLKGYIVRHLRDAATNSTDDITKFADAGYRRALRDIGDEKLGVFFSPEELQHLKDVGNAAKYMKAQPDGSAVNNSNSGALMLGRGLDMLDRVAGYVPFGGKDIIRGRIQGMQQTQVLAPRNALALAAEPAAAPLRVNPLLAAAVATPAQGREDKRGR